ncbi:translation initiation factor aIF-2 [Sphaceloma murrayae]|uniref:Eukaryotic translation initiation factor 5B n=1 Tax=Sphaceloma murrayae TaxID=2082308 RepID=A0A2K1QP10_9PEZI|nr:translation initiation factor aIF-2 [Sphaceloma murrayae]
MPPKKKGGKKQQDDWEADLGESIDPIAQAEQEAKKAEAEAEADKDGEEEGGGGLLAALKRNRAKKGKKGKQEDFIEGEDPTDGVEDAPAKIDLDAKAPVEASMDEDVFGQPMKKGKGGKGKQEQKDDEDDEDEGEAGGRVKTKKEKEREKKEREKARKKEQLAAKKKATGPAVKDEVKVAEVVKEAAPAPVEAPAAGGKKKKLNPALAAIQKQQEELRRRQEEEARLREEERQQEEAQRKKQEEEEARQAELKAAKKAKEKAKIEAMKKEGKYMTKAQKEADARAKVRLQQMIESGATVAGLGDDEGKDKKPSERDRRKKNPKKLAEERKAQEAAKAAEEEEARKKLEELRIADEQAKAAEEAAAAAKANAEEKKGEESDGLDDWEVEAEKLDSDVKDSWDALSDEDGEIKSVANGKPAQAGAAVDASKRKPNGAQAGDDDDSDSDSEEDSEEDSSDSEEETALQKRKAESAQRRKMQMEEARKNASADNLRSPICCILGHVDTGKTKLLDKIRQTNVQEGEAGGITQQIGATYFPVDALIKKTAVVNADGKFEFKVPGLLIIDTPGHESFTNLRSRGSSLCNIAILVVDIMHGLEPQTLESMRLLRDRKTPFIVALNKIDRLYGWKKIENNGFQESFAFQNKSVQNEFRDRLEKTKLAFAEQGFNSELYFENKSMARNVSLVPTSAHTGEGIPDMLKLLVQLTQERMTNQLMYLSEVECTVLEVKVIEGLGTTIDVVLSNGVLREGDRIVLCGLDGPIITDIRALLTPAEMKELRVKSQYVHNKEVKAALGVKITANGLDNAIAGSRLLVVKPGDDEDDLADDVMGDLENLLSRISKTGRGVTVQASTLGSLEALLEFLKQMKIPVSNISIGPVHKRDVITASTMLEKSPEYAVMLCFDVKVDKEAQQHADDLGVIIYKAEIIYHLFDQFTKHMDEIKEKKKEESKLLAVFPCVLQPLQVFNKKDPIVIGVDVAEGSLRIGTPLCVVQHNSVTGVKSVLNLGRVTSIQREHKAVPICKKGQPSVAVKIEGPNQPMYGRQLEDKETIYSLISRASIDTLKTYFRDEVTKDEWALIVKLKPLMDVQ